MTGFVFQWPGLLALLLLAIPMVWMLARARQRRLQLIRAMGGSSSTHRRLRDVLRVAAFLCLVLALARPGYAPRTESLSRTGRDVVFALDVSQSMLAEDAAPSRLEVAKQGIRDALNTFGNERVGFVVYAGSSSILCPLTYDYDFVRYMLEQANPRTVDFGGTTLQSAVEKVVDQVFMDGRGGVQDLVVLTDGGDHGSKTRRIVELLDEAQVDVLLVGLGNRNEGAPIRIKDDAGNSTLLTDDEGPVYTKLDDAALREFASVSNRVEYIPAGVDPFNLGQIYLDYASGRQVVSSESEKGLVVYREAAVFFLLPALLFLLLAECWGSKGLQLGQAGAIVLALALQPRAEAATESFKSAFENAVAALEQGAYEEAAVQFSDLFHKGSDQLVTPAELAAVEFNMGLSLVRLSEEQQEVAPMVALNYAREAQLAFLAAKRSAPGLVRAGVRVESTATLVSDLEQRVADQQALEAEINALIEKLIKDLQSLLKSQENLRMEVASKDIKRKPPPPAPPVEAPAHALSFVDKQTELVDEGVLIVTSMQQIDSLLTPPPGPQPLSETLMSEPIRLMTTVQETHPKAVEKLQDWQSWPAARYLQQSMENLIVRILELLASDSQQSAEDSDEWEEMDEEDSDYMDDSEESMASSDGAMGDLAAGSEMQALPVPNYSADDILMEEQGNLQFRQQKRASANAAKVEKDY